MIAVIRSIFERTERYRQSVCWYRWNVREISKVADGMDSAKISRYISNRTRTRTRKRYIDSPTASFCSFFKIQQWSKRYDVWYEKVLYAVPSAICQLWAKLLQWKILQRAFMTVHGGFLELSQFRREQSRPRCALATAKFARGSFRVPSRQAYSERREEMPFTPAVWRAQKLAKRPLSLVYNSLIRLTLVAGVNSLRGNALWRHYRSEGGVGRVV